MQHQEHYKYNPIHKMLSLTNKHLLFLARTFLFLGCELSTSSFLKMLVVYFIIFGTNNDVFGVRSSNDEYKDDDDILIEIDK